MKASSISLMLAKLEREGMLQSQGRSRGKVYYLPGSVPVSPEQVFTSATSSGSNEASSGSNETTKILPIITGTELLHRNEQGCLISPLLDAPIIDSLAALSPSLRDDLLLRAALPRAKARLDKENMANAILAICEGRYVRLSVLAELLQRDADGLRKIHLDALVKSQRIRRAFPSTPTHEMQSYCAAKSP